MEIRMSFNRFALISSLTAAAMAAAGCGTSGPQKGQGTAAPPTAVHVVKAERVTVPVEVEAAGTVRARVTSVLSARLMGQIMEIRVHAGDPVRAGQTIAVLDSREIETGYQQAEAAQAEARGALPEAAQAVAAAKAQADLAETTLKRMKTLHDSKSISEQEFDEAKARHRGALAQYEMALARQKQVDARIRQTREQVAAAALHKGYTEVKAPFAGVVIERKAEPGMLAAPGMPLAVLEQSGAYRLEVAVEESLLPKVKVGQKVPVTLDALDRQFDARISEIVPALDPGSRSFTAKIDLPAIPELRSGVFGRARFPTGQQSVVLVPAAAVLEDGQVQRVYVAAGGLAQGRLVSLGAQRGDRFEVLSGLTAGESVVTAAPPGLQDGARIEVRQ